MPAPIVRWLQPSPRHYGGLPFDVRCIGLHATAGRNSGPWLSTTSDPPVSIHALINKDGSITRIVPDDQAAYHMGGSSLGDYTPAAGDDGSVNSIAYGIELENENDGRDPYPIAQIDACGWEIARVWRKFGCVPIIPHALVDAPGRPGPGGKTDPRGLDLARVFRAALTWYDGAPPDSSPITPREPYTERSPIMTSPGASYSTVVNRWRYDERNYTAESIIAIIAGYYNLAAAVGLDPVIALAQMAHETGSLTSAWSAVPQRNPAGIGVNGVWTLAQPKEAGWAYNTDRQRWEMGVSFPDWHTATIAHLGRLLAYCLPAGAGTELQRSYIDRALAARPLPAKWRGTCSTLQDLETKWAPGTTYGDRIASHANRIAGVV